MSEKKTFAKKLRQKHIMVKVDQNNHKIINIKDIYEKKKKNFKYFSLIQLLEVFPSKINVPMILKTQDIVGNSKWTASRTFRTCFL